MSTARGRNGGPSWGAYEPRGGGPSGGGNRGGGGFNRGRGSGESANRQQSEQDDVWAVQYDRVHGADHPNNTGTSKARNATNAARYNLPNRGQNQGQDHPQSGNQRRGNGFSGGDSNRNRGMNNAGFSNNGNAGKYNGGGSNYRGGSHNRHGGEPGSASQSSAYNNDNNNGMNRAAPPTTTSSGYNDNQSRHQQQSYNPQPQTQQSYNARPQNQQTHNPPPNYNASGSSKLQLQVLYTHQKTKKKKSWKDGRLVLSGTSASLFDACPNAGSAGGAVDSLELSRTAAQALRDGMYGDDFLESEKYLVQVEGPWVDPAAGNGGNNILWNKQPQAGEAPGGTNGGLRRGTQPSAGMKKLLSSKFRMPGKVRPLHPEERRRRAWEESGANKRQRPLQPGELERQFYGGGGDGNGGHPNSGGGYGPGGFDNGRTNNGRGDYGNGGGRYNDAGGPGRNGCQNDGGYQGQNSGRCPPNDGSWRGNDRSNVDGGNQRGNDDMSRNPYNGSESGQDRHGGRQSNQQQPQQFRNDGRNGSNDGPPRGNQPQFQSNYDASGFYAMEDEESDSEGLNEGSNNVSNGERQERGRSALDDDQTGREDNVRGASQRPPAYRGRDEDDRRQSERARRDPSREQVPREVAYENGPPPEPNDDDDSLFALLGATKAPAPAQQPRPGNASTTGRNEEPGYGEDATQNGEGGTGGKTDANADATQKEKGGEDNDSFLAGILGAEEERANNPEAARSDSPLAFGAGSSWDEFDEGSDDGLGEEEAAVVDKGNNEGAGASGGGFSGFTLPSAGESSSEDEEEGDSDAG